MFHIEFSTDAVDDKNEEIQNIIITENKSRRRQL